MAVKNWRKLFGAWLLTATGLVAVGGTGTPAGAQTAEPIIIRNVQAAADSITLSGTGKIQATAFILGEPIRLRVDISGATLDSSAPASIPVNGDPIQSVTATTLSVKEKRMVRLELALTRDVDWQMQPAGDSLTITLTPRQEEEQAAISEDVYQQARKVEEELYTTGTYTPPPSDLEMPKDAALNQQPVLAQPMYYPTAPIQPAVAPPGRPTLPPARGNATQVVDVRYRISGGNLQVLIETNGAVGKIDPFTLGQPNRLVIDIPGLKLASPQSRFALGQAGALRVRLGAHPGKTRAVIDFSGPVPAYSFSRVKQGLVITLSQP